MKVPSLPTAPAYTLPLDYFYDASHDDRLTFSVREQDLIASTAGNQFLRHPQDPNSLGGWVVIGAPDSIYLDATGVVGAYDFDARVPNGFRLRVYHSLSPSDLDIVAAPGDETAAIVVQLMQEIHMLETLLAKQPELIVAQSTAIDNPGLYQAYRLGEVVTPVPDLYRAIWGVDPVGGRALDGTERIMCGIMAGLGTVTTVVPTWKAAILMRQSARGAVDKAAAATLAGPAGAGASPIVKNAADDMARGVNETVQALDPARRPGWFGVGLSIVDGAKRVGSAQLMSTADMMALHGQTARFSDGIAAQTGAGAGHSSPIVAMETAGDRIVANSSLVRGVRGSSGSFTKTTGGSLAAEHSNLAARQRLRDLVVSEVGNTDEATKLCELLARTPGCFPAGTFVSMADESAKRIEDVREGDLVLTRDDSDPVCSRAAGRVGEVTIRTVDRLFELRIIDESWSADRLTVSGEHPFWVDGQGWTAAQELKSGDRLSGGDSSMLVVEVTATELTRPIDVYNFSVVGGASYFVHGESGARLWVHNTPCDRVVAAILKEIHRQRLLQGLETRTLQEMADDIRRTGTVNYVRRNVAQDLTDDASQILSKALQDAYGLETLVNAASHHLIPTKVASRFVRFLSRVGYFHNVPRNGALLPEVFTPRAYGGLSIVNDFARHAGNHGGCSYAVFKKMKEIEKAFDDVIDAPGSSQATKDAAVAAARKSIELLQDTIRVILDSNQVALVAGDVDKTQRQLYKIWARRLGVKAPGDYTRQW